MKFVAVFLACVVAAQAFVDPSMGGKGFEDIRVDGLMKDKPMGGWSAVPNYNHEPTPNKWMGGKSMGGKSGWSAVPNYNHQPSNKWMGGKSMGGKSMGRKSMDKWMDDFMNMDMDMPRKSMGKSMGGKSMGWSATPSYNHEPTKWMGGKSMGGKSGWSAVPNYNHQPSNKWMGGKSMGGKSGWSSVPKYHTGLLPTPSVPKYHTGILPTPSVPKYHTGLLQPSNKWMKPMAGKSAGFDSAPLVPSGEISGADTGFAAVPTVHHEVNKFACPPYQYWACHQFHVLPRKDLYCYTIHFNRAWCTTQYYCDVLAEYPKCLEKNTCEKESENIDALIAGIETKLKEKRTEIETEITKNRDAFVTQIEHVHAEYVEALKCYLAKCYSTDSYTYTQKVACYEAELAGCRIHAITNLETAVRNAISRIEVFHAQLIARFRSCLTKRTEAIKTYCHKIEHTATCYVAAYKTKLEEVKTKKTAFINCIFERLYAGKDKPAQFADFLTHFKTELESKLKIDLDAFQAQINAFLVEVKESYRCGYKCAFTTFGKDFTKKTFSKSGTKFPSMPKADCKLVAVGPFNIDWKACEIKNLKTLPAEEKECKFDEQIHLDHITASVENHEAELKAKIALWKSQTDSWCHTATVTLNHRVNCLVPKSYCGHTPSQAEIDACRAAAQIRATNWIKAQKGQLEAHIASVDKAVKAQIAAWKTHAEKHVKDVKAAFDECVSTKSAKITSYTELLTKTKDTQRAALVAKLDKCKEQHKAQFEKFWEAAFGTEQADAIVTDMKATYLKCVDDHVAEVLKKFDDWWAEFTPKLIEHHTCGLKCKANVCTPSLRLCYNWTWCAPNVNCFHFYC